MFISQRKKGRADTADGSKHDVLDGCILSLYFNGSSARPNKRLLSGSLPLQQAITSLLPERRLKLGWKLILRTFITERHVFVPPMCKGVRLGTADVGRVGCSWPDPLHQA